MVRVIDARPLNKIVSHLPIVQAAIVEVTEQRGAIARRVHEAHKDRGDSQIIVATPPNTATDGYVILNDERGFSAAAAIEYGTYRSRGVGALHAAAKGG